MSPYASPLLRRPLTRFSVLGMLLANLVLGGKAVDAATYAVGTTTDSSSLTTCTATPSASCSLRGAIILANSSLEADVIQLTAATYKLTLSGTDSTPFAYQSAQGDLDITRPLTINGNGATIDANFIDRGIDIGRYPPTAFTVVLNDLTVVNGRPKGLYSLGGGIRANGVSLTLNRCALRSNSTYEAAAPRDDPGGALVFARTLDVPAANASLQISECTLAGNYGGNGGAICLVDARASIQASTLNANVSTGEHGGTIYFTGSSTLANLSNLTISQNNVSNASGGAVSGGFGGLANLANCTIYGNAVNGSSGQVLNAISDAVRFNVINSLFASASASSLSSGALQPAVFTSLGNNAFTDAPSAALPSDRLNISINNVFGTASPALADNGGRVQTLAISSLAANVARNGGSNSVTANLSTDARGSGFARLRGTAVDIGAFESNATPTNVGVTPSGGTSAAGVPRTFTAVYSDSDGALDITWARILINASLNGAGALYGYYDQVANKLYLFDDAGTTLLGGFAPGSSNTITNSRGSLNCAATTVARSGNNLTINWTFTPKPAFAGAKNIYLLVKDGLVSAGWDLRASWTFGNSAPVNVSVTPASGTTNPGASRTFTTLYTDAEGAGDIRTVRLLINSSLNPANALYGYYDRIANKLYLFNNAGTEVMGGFAPGSANVISNSQGSLNCAATTVSASGTNLTVNWAFTPAAGFLGAKNLYMLVKDATTTTGFDLKGTWTIGNVAPANGSVTPASGTSASGAARTITTTHTDANGATDISVARILINSSVTGAGALYGYYDRAANRLYLFNNAGTATTGGFAPGSANVITNSQGSLNCASTTVNASGNTLTINWSFSPTAAFAGSKNIYALVRDAAGLQAGFDARGTWTVTSSGGIGSGDASGGEGDGEAKPIPSVRPPSGNIF